MGLDRWRSQSRLLRFRCQNEDSLQADALVTLANKRCRGAFVEVQPVGLIGATLVVQLFVMLLITVTNRVLPQGGYLLLRSHCDRAVLGMALLTVACLVASDDLYRLTAPMFGDLAFSGALSRNTTFLVLFISDLLITFRLIQVTGGSKSSPFTAILFLLPTVAIFLREPASRFIPYALLAATLYIVGLLIDRSNDKTVDVLRGALGGGPPDFSIVRTDTPAHAIVNLGCLLIGTATGYVTRPLPVSGA